MGLSLYALLLRLTCQKSAQYLQGYRKKSGKLLHLLNLLSVRHVILRKINVVQ